MSAMFARLDCTSRAPVVAMQQAAVNLNFSQINGSVTPRHTTAEQRSRLASSKTLALVTSPAARGRVGPGSGRGREPWTLPGGTGLPATPQSCFPALRTLCATASTSPTVVNVPPTMAQTDVTKSYHLLPLEETTTAIGDRSYANFASGTSISL